MGSPYIIVIPYRVETVEYYMYYFYIFCIFSKLIRLFPFMYKVNIYVSFILIISDILHTFCKVRK